MHCWVTRKLQIFGFCLIIKSLIIPFTVCFLQLKNLQLEKIQDFFFKFGTRKKVKSKQIEVNKILMRFPITV